MENSLTDPWSNYAGTLISVYVTNERVELDLGSVNAPPPLDHRDSGVGWSRVALAALCVYWAASFKPQATLDSWSGI